tara:strand:+ start:18028 stop:18906 length:879 start_codon:yes stop_codon:yes gene_type:complete
MRPNFFIVGAPKCGTTAWVDYLSCHPDICFSSSKEPHFFSEDFPKFRWACSLDSYLDFFQDCENFKIIGDASVQYLYSKTAAQKISEFSPNAKILIMLREPSSFIRSYHNQLLMNCDETETDLRKAWGMSGVRSSETVPKTCREPAFLDYKRVGRFSEQVERYLNYFPFHQVKIVFMHDWIDDPRRLYMALMDFLALRDDQKAEFPVVHAAKHVSSRRLHRLSQRPPDSLKMIMSSIRKIPGLGNFRGSNITRKLNYRVGYNKAVDNELMREIEAYFAEDQINLSHLVDSLK